MMSSSRRRPSHSYRETSQFRLRHRLLNLRRMPTEDPVLSKHGQGEAEQQHTQTLERSLCAESPYRWSTSPPPNRSICRLDAITREGKLHPHHPGREDHSVWQIRILLITG